MIVSIIFLDISMNLLPSLYNGSIYSDLGVCEPTWFSHARGNCVGLTRRGPIPI